jgi:hypothetical protein
MATWTKLPLSGSTNGRPIKVVATSLAGTTIHTAAATTGVDNYDEVWLFGYNSDTANRSLTVQFGGTTAPDDSITITLSPQAGLFLVLPGIIIQNSLVVKAFASTANVVMVSGYVNRSAA